MRAGHTPNGPGTPGFLPLPGSDAGHGRGTRERAHADTRRHTATHADTHGEQVGYNLSYPPKVTLGRHRPDRPDRRTRRTRT